MSEQLQLQAVLRSINFRSLDSDYAEVASRIGDRFSVTYSSATHVMPEPVRQAFSSASLMEYVTFRQVPHSEAVLRSAHQRARSALGDVKADSWNEVNRGAIVVLTERVPDSSTVSAVESSAAPVQIEWAVGQLSLPAATYGGYTLESCTAGFVVYDIDTANRMLGTAGHCSFTEPSYLDLGNLNYKGTSYVGRWDFQWHDKGGVTWGARVFDGSGTRAITGRRSRSLMGNGDQIVKYGKTTGYTTGTIINVSFCPSYVPNCQPTFILADSNDNDPIVAKGDSGGPVMLNGVAYGFTSGVWDFVSGSESFGNMIIFMAQNYTQEDANVKVLTQ